MASEEFFRGFCLDYEVLVGGMGCVGSFIIDLGFSDLGGLVQAFDEKKNAFSMLSVPDIRCTF